MYLGGYNKNNIDKNQKIIILTIARIFKLLIDKESETKISNILESII